MSAWWERQDLGSGSQGVLVVIAVLAGSFKSHSLTFTKGPQRAHLQVRQALSDMPGPPRWCERKDFTTRLRPRFLHARTISWFDFASTITTRVHCHEEELHVHPLPSPSWRSGRGIRLPAPESMDDPNTDQPLIKCCCAQSFNFQLQYHTDESSYECRQLVEQYSRPQ